MKAQTDRELLELAAKAAGIVGEYDQRLTGDGIAPTGQSCRVWNPLTDDGDALRLAVKLGMPIWHRTGGIVHGVIPGMSFWDRSLDESLSPDPYAATRRAIVRAAAALTQGA